MSTGKFDKLVENVMSGKSLFNESKSSAKAKYLDRLSPDKAKAEEIFNKLLALDTTINKRYVEWMAKMVAETPEIAIDRFNVIHDYERLNNEQKLTPAQKDFVKFAKLEDMEKVIADIKAAGPTKSELKAGISKKIKGGKVPAELQDKVFWEGANSFVLVPSTKEEGIKFGNKGSGTKWCISSDDPSYNEWNMYYYEKAANIYIIVPFRPEELPENWKKLAVLAYPGGKLEWYDFNDKELVATDPRQIDEIIAKLGDESWK